MKSALTPTSPDSPLTLPCAPSHSSSCQLGPRCAATYTSCQSPLPCRKQSCLLPFSPSLRASSAIWEARCRDEGGLWATWEQRHACRARAVLAQWEWDSWVRTVRVHLATRSPAGRGRAALIGAERQACVKVPALGSVAMKRSLQGENQYIHMDQRLKNTPPHPTCSYGNLETELNCMYIPRSFAASDLLSR